MAITSLDIANQSFSIDRKGYDVDEVDVFLERVAEEIDAFNEEIDRLKELLENASAAQPQEPVIQQVVDTAAIEERDARIATLERELNAKNEKIISLRAKIDEMPVVNDSAIAQALIVAQRSADEVVSNANTQSEQIISDAREDAENIVTKAREEKAAIDEEIKELEIEREEARGMYQDMLRNFINDATKKLGSLDERHAAHQQRLAPNTTGRVMSKNQVPVAGSADSTTAFTLDQKETVTTVAPTPSAVEKDLSGFGDSDDFSFEELD